MQVDWELSQQFVSDSQGVRAACVLPSNNDVDAYRIVTGNQGGGLCEFGVPSAALYPIEYQHNHAVTALLTIDELQVYVTGCKDALVRVFDYSHQLKATLKGHEKPVTSLSVVKSNDGTPYLVTGSWDGTAKVWDVTRQAMLATLPDHENSVCVAGLEAESSSGGTPHVVHIATGSAGIPRNNQVQDHTVRIWTVNVQSGQVACTASLANDHEGSIRGIAIVKDYIGTCSNDGTVRLRTRDKGDSIATLSFVYQNTQHPPMLLSVAPISVEDGGASSVAASAEDGHVVIWTQAEDGGSIQEPQIIMHPSCVWNVIGLPKGDFATCCQDGTLRIFTKASDRMASQAEKEAFGKAVQEASQKKSSGPSAEEVAKLPLWELNLQKRGTSEGQVQLFNKNGNAIAAQWSMSSQTWIEVGQVMGSADGGSIDGVQYDHVLPIEVDQTGGGVAKLQLGYNNGENPFVAAQRFIDSYVLPQYHLNDIANYIQQRVGSQGRTLGGGPTSSLSSGMGPVATAGVPIIAYQHLPIPGYKSFELPPKTASTTLEKMKKKIEETATLSDTQLASVSSLMETLAATNRYHSSKIQPEELKVIMDMLESLPPADAFPALDLARLAVAHPDAASLNNTTQWNKIICKALSMCEDTPSLEGPAAVAIPMLSLRLFANAFRGGPGSQQAVVDLLESVLKCNETFLGSGNKNIRLSVATVLYNTSFYLHSKDASPVYSSQVVVQVDNILKNRSYETEALVRAMIALGTVAMSSPEAKETAKSLFVVSRVEMAASPHGDTAKAVAKEVYTVLS
ncbi:WD-40 repeat-containing protein [Nitzschia inconspicua]|uniref:WD-40 repeat-containing protein n=1 Tax=Nitzschia inconspicua TaxID=303405 RepID=A0A9K3KLX8_9STRA|nr:WD-40 repeat-containing protein [Nitzschia inconspicua]